MACLPMPAPVLRRACARAYPYLRPCFGEPADKSRGYTACFPQIFVTFAVLIVKEDYR